MFSLHDVLKIKLHFVDFITFKKLNLNHVSNPPKVRHQNIDKYPSPRKCLGKGNRDIDIYDYYKLCSQLKMAV